MNIKVELKGNLRKLSNRNLREDGVDLKEGTKLYDLLEELNIKRKQVSFIAINCLVSKTNDKLHNKDTVKIFPFFGGG